MEQNFATSFMHWQFFPVVEFSLIISLVIVTYWGIYVGFGQIKPVVKMLISMFLGSVGYMIGKVAVVALVTYAF